MNPFNPNEFPIWLRGLARVVSVFGKPGHQFKAESTDKFDTLNKIPYDRLREDILNGDLLFCCGEYAFSKVIRFFSGGSRVSHIGIVYWWNGRLMLLECVESDGVRIVPVSQYLKNYENTQRPYKGRVFLARDNRFYQTHESLRNPQVENLLAQAATLLNTKFGLWDVVEFFWKGATGWGVYRVNDYFLCSEFVAKCFELIGLECPASDGSGFVTPEDIASATTVTALCEIIPEQL